MPTLYSGQNSWPVRQKGIFVQNLPFFFFFQKNFQFCCWTTKYVPCKFWFENAEIVIRSKFFTSRTKRHFHTNIARVFIYFIYIYIYRIFNLFLRPPNLPPISFQAKMATLHSGQNSWPVGTRSVFVQNLPEFFSHSKEFSIFF